MALDKTECKSTGEKYICKRDKILLYKVPFVRSIGNSRTLWKEH